MTQGIEARKSNRRRTLFGGLLFDKSDKKWDCKISNFSDTGALVKCPAELKLGDVVEIKIVKFNDLRSAEVMWVSKGTYGLRFLVKIKKDQKGMAELFRLMEE
ncbi:MAG: hypothetical protein A3G18_04930 [Rhodospirillales bacterium RIFCSPLOWO2_12_FULL_58_28]|nr:MAG: hypothetical protein A3H92_03780 [Rhodospirillales bacterium RIFCSPLOWO2_02_FULL_58_16]OHC78258.1 MAG: hypothetical protein A3G18_04930 [Rhodospirillales bacterium RIFCSPLOWO2_12_FULL_58_28]